MVTVMRITVLGATDHFRFQQNCHEVSNFIIEHAAEKCVEKRGCDFNAVFLETYGKILVTFFVTNFHAENCRENLTEKLKEKYCSI